MKRLLSGILLTSVLWVLTGNFALRAQTLAIVEKSPEETELFYTYYGKKIPLKQRRDVIAVAFKPEARGSSFLPLYLKLQQDFRRTQNASNIEVEPLGQHYALMKMTSGNKSQVQLSLSKKAYVDSTLPVVSRQGNIDKIILPNEIVISFDEKISSTQKLRILQQYNLEIIRPLRFSNNRYVVKSKTASGTGILQVANRLYQEKRVKSATPNFIQQRSQNFSRIAREPRKKQAETNLLAQQWHLNSNPLRICLIQFSDNVDKCLSQRLYESKSSVKRTDIRATEAWKNSQAGKGVLVAVLDDFIQWNHPDLASNIYTVGKEEKSKLKDEKHGWDFVDDDPDTRISDRELAVLRPVFQDTFKLSDNSLLEKYRYYALNIKQNNPFYTRKQIAQKLRDNIRKEVAGFFHGTWVSGIIAASSEDVLGLVGVAPKAKILPVTVCKIGCEISHIIEGIDYAVARGADVINMSFGGYLPSAEIRSAIMRAHRNNPNLIIVAAAGNEKNFEVNFPSVVKGVISVGATNINGNRAPYSNFGNRLTMVAPGGDTSMEKIGDRGGILTAGGTGIDGFWQGIILKPKTPWSGTLDSRGKYIRVQGTSFASPVVAGVIALMKGEDPQRRLSRKEIISILKQTASYDGLTISKAEKQRYRTHVLLGKVSPRISIEQYFFGNGMVNAHTAVKEVQRQLKKSGK